MFSRLEDRGAQLDSLARGRRLHGRALASNPACAHVSGRFGGQASAFDEPHLQPVRSPLRDVPRTERAREELAREISGISRRLSPDVADPHHGVAEVLGDASVLVGLVSEDDGPFHAECRLTSAPERRQARLELESARCLPRRRSPHERVRQRTRHVASHLGQEVCPMPQVV